MQLLIGHGAMCPCFYGIHMRKASSGLIEKVKVAKCNTSMGMLNPWNLSVKFSVSFVMKSVMMGVIRASGAVFMNPRSREKCSNPVAVRSVVKMVSLVLKAQSFSTKSAIYFSHPCSPRFRVFKCLKMSQRKYISAMNCLSSMRSRRFAACLCLHT